MSDWRDWPRVADRGSRPREIGNRAYWPVPAEHAVANERRYLLISVAIGSMLGPAPVWATEKLEAPVRYRGPLRTFARRGYSARLTRDGIALWPTYSQEPEPADPYQHPVRIGPRSGLPPRR